MERTWTGRLLAGRTDEHERFVEWLRSADGQGLLARSLLTSYRLAEADGRITVTLAADEPPPIIRFLRNRRFWPECWEFESADRSAAFSPATRELVAWRAGSPSGD